jgi:hypothetical protein
MIAFVLMAVSPVEVTCKEVKYMAGSSAQNCSYSCSNSLPRTASTAAQQLMSLLHVHVCAAVDITQTTASDIIWSDRYVLPGSRPNQERNVGVLVGPDALQVCVKGLARGPGIRHNKLSLMFLVRPLSCYSV